MFPYNFVIAILCSGIFTIGCLYVYEVKHPRVMQPEANNEDVQATFDDAYMTGYQDAKAGLPMPVEIVARSRLADAGRLEAYAMPAREQAI